MGRYSTGAMTTGQAIRLELSYLFEKGYLEKGKETYGGVSWTNGFYIIVEGHLSEGFIQVVYQVKNSFGENKSMKYKIFLESVPSNLGRGEVYYFLCPVSGKRCRILYMAYGSYKWKCREAYQNRLYYASQKCSKMSYANERYWALDDKIKAFKKKGFRYTYNGKPTRKAKQLRRMTDELLYWDAKSWSIESFPHSIRKELRQIEEYERKGMIIA